MANEHHLEMLQRGVEAWNQWRKEHREIWPELSGADLSHLDLSGIHFHKAFLHHANLRSARLCSAVLNDANLIHSNLEGADLSDGSLGGANLSQAYLAEANLSRANLFDTNLSDAKLYKADLTGADLYQTNFTRADLRDANFMGAQFGYTLFVDTDLQVARGLAQTRHRCRSYMDLMLLKNGFGKLPLAFLRGIGISENLLHQYHASQSSAFENHGQPAPEYSPCFITYAKDDTLFAERLYEDLQQRGVRCWLDADGQLEERLRYSVPHILVLSHASIQLNWEYTEEPDWMFHAVIDGLYFEEEHGGKRIFPVKIDETISQYQEDWAKRLRQSRTIGDFTHQGISIQYQVAFERLVGYLVVTAR